MARAAVNVGLGFVPVVGALNTIFFDDSATDSDKGLALVILTVEASTLGVGALATAYLKGGTGAARGAEVGLRVASSGVGAAPAVVVREIAHGEKVAGLVEEVAERTYLSGGLEHAIISMQSGQRLIVQGGRGGIEFGEGLRRVILHSHPTPTGPSAADFMMLQQTGQRSSWIYELFGGGLTRFRSP